MEASAGEVLLGKYRVDRLIGRGGFGYVVAATHLHLGERVAIKFLHPEFAANSVVVARFLREAQAAAKLKSNHAVHAVDVGTLPSGAPYIVMEYLEGEDLESLVRRNGPLPAMTATAWLLDACEAIAEAHALGIVHRDLKPANVFLARGPGLVPVVKVLDFGISKFATGMDVSLTKSSTVLGSPMYAAPEQLRSTRDADARSDIWSLGVTLYRLVSGRVPFPGETISEVCMKVAVDPVPPLPEVLGLPPGLEQVIDRCLEKDPRKRYQDIGAFATALAPFAGKAGLLSLDRVIDALGRSTVPMSRTVSDSPPARPATITQPAGEIRWQRPAKPHGAMIAGIGVAVVAAVALVVFGQLGGRQPEVLPPRPASIGADPSAPAATTVAPAPATAWRLPRVAPDAAVAIDAPDATVAESTSQPASPSSTGSPPPPAGMPTAVPRAEHSEQSHADATKRIRKPRPKKTTKEPIGDNPADPFGD